MYMYMYNTEYIQPQSDQSSYWKRADATIRSLHFEVLKNLQTAARNAYFRVVFQSTFFSSTCPLLFHSQDIPFIIRSNGHFPQSQHTSAPWNESHPSIHFLYSYVLYISYNIQLVCFSRYTHYDLSISCVLLHQ